VTGRSSRDDGDGDDDDGIGEGEVGGGELKGEESLRISAISISPSSSRYLMKLIKMTNLIANLLDTFILLSLLLAFVKAA
jgi:hypothetical protein